MKTLNQIIILASLLVFASCEEAKLADEVLDELELAQVDPPVSDCSTAPASWFVETGGTRVTPAPNEDSTSVFANSSTVTNCDFHRWSWQKFLWLTNETNGVPFFRDNLRQVGADGSDLGINKPINLTGTSQASDTGDILKTSTAASTTENTVYYSIMVNEQYYSTMLKYGKMAHNSIDSIKDIAFPVGALETKSSWIAASALSDTTSYFITDGTIAGTPTRVALLGLHVVGIVENHPEFIWATFEHADLAPSYDWDEATETTDATVRSPDDFPFFDSNDSASIKNIQTQNGIFTNIFSLYKFGVPIEKVGNSQEYMVTSQNGEENVGNITSLNQSVKEQLKGVWNNYFYNGSLWVDMENINTPTDQIALLNNLSGNLGDASEGKLLRGSVAAYNITMETYVQTGYSATSIHAVNVGNLANCFFCHTANHKSHDSPLQISHLFNGYVGSLKGLSKAQIKEEHVSMIRAKAILKQINQE